MIKYIIRILAVGALIISLSACSSITENIGYAPMDDELEPLEIGVTTKDEVSAAIGLPATTNQRYGDDWFYVMSKLEKRGYNEPEEISRRVVLVSFDEERILSNISVFSLEDGHVVKLSRRITETNLGRLNFIQQIMKGLGRIDPTNVFEGN